MYICNILALFPVTNRLLLILDLSEYGIIHEGNELQHPSKFLSLFKIMVALFIALLCLITIPDLCMIS